MRPFAHRVRESGEEFVKRKVDVLQVNMRKYCNQACLHCHVEAGPGRREMMTRQTVNGVLAFLEGPTVDITGGAPELNPNFDYFVESCVGLNRHVMDRCNLTVIFEPGKNYLAEFFARNHVELVCSLPCYTAENVDSQRGDGTFELSIRALRVLNRLGYGDARGGLELDLVLLEANFNPATLASVMCRNLLSVGWEGSLYDCDFNQMIDLPLRDRDGKPIKIWDVTPERLERRPIIIGNHYYACTAGAGSSCGGALLR